MSDTDRRDGDPTDPVGTGGNPADAAPPSAGPDPLAADPVSLDKDASGSPPPPPLGAPVNQASSSDEDKIMVILTHAANIVGIFTGGIGNIVAIILAFVKKDTAPDWARSHYVLAIRSVVIGLIACIVLAVIMAISVPLMLIGIGFLTMGLASLGFVLVGVWILVRSVVAMLKANRQEPYPNPETWMV